MTAYPHLHVHSYYTLLGATPSPEALAQRAAADGMTHLALTDTHGLYGAVTFDRACRAAGIQPILGLVVHVTWPEDIAHPPHSTTDAAGRGSAVEDAAPLVLLAHSPAGYRALCRLSSMVLCELDRASQDRGLPLDALRDHSEGLLCLAGGRRGWATRALAAGNSRGAHRFLGKLCGIYGAEQVYISLERHTDKDLAVGGLLEDKAAFLGLRTVAIQPVYTLAAEDRSRLQLLAAIEHGCPLGEVPPHALPDAGDRRVDVHWLPPETMAARFADMPEALNEAQRIAERCAPLGSAGILPTTADRLYWPTLDLPQGETPEAALRAQATAGCRRQYANDGGPLPELVQARLARELDVIADHGYAPLFLVVADIVRYTRAHDIPVSTRGSVANSLVAYALGITTVDPVAHGLLFERFLSPGRTNPPDIDLDFCSRRRDEVLAYIRRRYGEDRVALVGAMSTLRLRSALRETAKAYEVDDKDIRTLLAALPRRRHPREGETRDEDTVIAGLGDPWLQQVARAAYGIAGLPHHLSIHAAGLIITPGPLTDLVPVQMTPKGYLTTQYNHGDTEAVGLPKLDLLGIRALTVLADAAAAVRASAAAPFRAKRSAEGASHTRTGEGKSIYDAARTFRLDEIPLDDPATSELLARGATVGVFQCDSVGARRTLRKLRARTVQDLAVANAFFKPGPATGGQADVFVRRYRGESPTEYLHPALAPILASTQGVLIFQEQVLRVATEIAGLSWAQADHIRRGMSKMAPAEMTELEAAFVAGCQRPDGPGFTSEQAEALWAQVSAFSGYGFNQGHATAYADVSYRSAYVKVHHPAAFFWARLRNYGGYYHPAVYMAEAMQMGIEVRPPHINHSRGDVVLSYEMPSETQASSPVLWLGLRLVRDLRRHAVADLLTARKAGPFVSLRDLLLRVELQPKEVTHLIQCGAMDGLGANRPTLLGEAASVARAGTARQLMLDLGIAAAPEASFAQRLAWERELLGYPLRTLRACLPVLRAEHRLPRTVADLPAARGHVKLLAVRLPGWHSRDYALWDGTVWTLAMSKETVKAPPAWEPVVLTGQWRSDRWGIGWLAVTEWRRISPSSPQASL